MPADIKEDIPFVQSKLETIVLGIPIISSASSTKSRPSLVATASVNSEPNNFSVQS